MKNNTGFVFGEWVEAGIENYNYPVLVSACGYQKFYSQNYNVMRPNGRKDYQLIHITKGKGYFKFDGKISIINQGGTILYKPYDEQCYEYHYTDGTELYWVHFTGYTIKDYLENKTIAKNLYSNILPDIDILEKFENIIYELQMKNNMYIELSGAYLLEIIAMFEREIVINKDKMWKEKDEFNKVIGHIYSNYEKNYSVEDYAKRFNLSLYHFIHKFKKLTGTTFVKYITKVRINEAKYLLLHSNMRIKEIAKSVGYDNPFYFSRIFKKVVGISPSDYQDSHKSKC